MTSPGPAGMQTCRHVCLRLHQRHTANLRPESAGQRASLLRLQDYVKWRGPLFHRFLLALVDESSSVCSLAEYLLTDTLASKVGSAPLQGLLVGVFALPCAFCLAPLAVNVHSSGCSQWSGAFSNARASQQGGLRCTWFWQWSARSLSHAIFWYSAARFTLLTCLSCSL